MEVTRDLWQAHGRQVALVYTVLCLVVPRYEGVKYFTVRGGQRNLTLKVNETFEVYFSFAEEKLADNRNISVYVQHRSTGANTFNTRCVLRPSRQNCSSSTGLCRCLRSQVDEYRFQKVVEKKDSGTWLFQLWGKSGETTETFYIIAQENDDIEETNNSTITTVTFLTTTNIIIIAACTGTVVIISLIIVVVCCCRVRSRKAARAAAATAPDSRILVATRSSRGRCIRQGDSAAYMSPASVMTVREYAGFLTPQQQMDIYSESPPNDHIYGNISSPVKQNRWKLGKRCSRLALRFLPLTTFPNPGVKNCGESCSQAFTDDDTVIYNNQQEDSIYANVPGVTQSSDGK